MRELKNWSGGAQWETHGKILGGAGIGGSALGVIDDWENQINHSWSSLRDRTNLELVKLLLFIEKLFKITIWRKSMCELPIWRDSREAVLRSLKGVHMNTENSDLITAKCTAVRFHLSFRCSSLICSWWKHKGPFHYKGGKQSKVYKLGMLYMGS